MSDDGHEEQPLRAANVGRRVAARVVDSLIWVLPTTVALNLAFGGAQPTDRSEAPDWFPAVNMAMAVAAFLYEVMLTWWLGQTIGKRLLRVKVRTLGTPAPPDLWRSAVRTVVVTALPVVLISERLSSEVGMALDFATAVVLLAFVLLRSDGRGLHDLAAGTRVVPAD